MVNLKRTPIEDRAPAFSIKFGHVHVAGLKFAHKFLPRHNHMHVTYGLRIAIDPPSTLIAPQRVMLHQEEA